MTDDGRSPLSALKGRLADVYVPALVSGSLTALARRLGERATIEDPRFGRCAGLAAIEPLLARLATEFAESQATYTQLASTAGTDRDATEGRLIVKSDGRTRDLPIAVVAERRRLREIELRVYYSFEGSPSTRQARTGASAELAGPHEVTTSSIDAIVDNLRRGLVHDALAKFEERGRLIDTNGRTHQRNDGALSAFLTGFVALDVFGTAEDSRTSCIEAVVTRSGRGANVESKPTLLAFERGDSGLVRELRIYER